MLVGIPSIAEGEQLLIDGGGKNFFFRNDSANLDLSQSYQTTPSLPLHRTWIEHTNHFR